MNFYDGTNKNGICQEIDRLCDSTDTSYPRLDKTARVNSSMEELVAEILTADGLWQWDDTNQTDQPRGKGTLVEGQDQYAFASEYLAISEIDVLDINGYYRRVRPLDPTELELSWDQTFGLDASGNPRKGFPLWYDKQGDSIRFAPAPSATTCTLTNGLRVTFQRTAVLFTPTSGTSDDTMAPGLPSTHHKILAYMAALPYCASYKKDRVAWLQTQITLQKKSLMEFYSKREKDDRHYMSMGSIRFK